MHPYSLALLVYRDTSFLLCSSGEVGVVREREGEKVIKSESLTPSGPFCNACTAKSVEAEIKK